MKKSHEKFDASKIHDQIVEEGLYDCNPALLGILGEEGEKLKAAIKDLKDYSLGEYEGGKSVYEIYNDVIKIYCNNGYKSKIDDAVSYCNKKFEEEFNKELEKQKEEFNANEENPYNDPEYRWRNDNGYGMAMQNLEHQAAFLASSNLSLPDDIDLPEIVKTAIIEVIYSDIAQTYGLTR